MKKFLLIFPAVLLFAAALSLTACGGNSSAEADQDADQTEMMMEGEAHDHDHAGEADHDHDHAGEADHDHDHAGGMHGEGPEYNSAYVCPMHCEGSGSDQPGTCPVCGMDYVAQKDHVGNGHTH